MSKFSVLFTELLEKKKVTIYSLAQNTNIDRTYLQKMKKGDRLPKEPDFIDELARAMQLTQVETMQLYDAFQITVLGEDKYLSRKEIVKIINTIYDVDNRKIFIKPSLALETDVTQFPQIIKGKNNVQNLIKLLLENAVTKGNCKIKLISQPSFHFLYDYISTLNLDVANVIIENIISFAIPSEVNSSLNNLSILEKIIPLFYNSSNYHPYYIYDSNPSITIEHQFMPIKIILPEISVSISSDYTQAIFSTNRDLNEVIEEYYNQIFHNTSPIFQSIKSDPNSYLDDILKFMDFNSKTNYNIMYQPCIFPFIPKNIFLDVLNVNALTQEIMDTIASYMDQFNNYSGTMYMTITRNGIIDFFEKNYLLEVPEFLMAHHPTMEQRLVVFKRMIEACKADKVFINIVEPHILKLSPSLLISAYTDKDVVIHHFSNAGDSVYIRLLEIGLASSFYEFLSNVHKSKLVKTKEESLKIMEAIYNEYMEKHTSQRHTQTLNR